MSESDLSHTRTGLSVVTADATRESVHADSRWSTLAASMARAVRRQCPAWLSADAQDIAQAALTKVMAAERKTEGERPLTSFYLHRVAHSALVDEIRRRKRRQEVSLEGTTESGDDARSFEPAFQPRAQGDPESHASFGELGTAVRECLQGAKRERRLAVTLYLQGHSVPEAARILGWDAKRTENLVYRGLADLRQCVMGKGHRP
jgi:RNA polymerase sigma-70 factor, ECF subfamily